MGKNKYVLMLLAGSFGLAVGGPQAVAVVASLLRSGATPAQATVASAEVGRWVVLSDARLRCDKRTVYRDSTTLFLATDAAGGNPFVAQFVGAVSCESAQANVNGGFVRATPRDLQRFGIEGDDSNLRLFTEALAPRYLRLALVIPSVIALIAVGLFAVGLRGVLRARRVRDLRP